MFKRVTAGAFIALALTMTQAQTSVTVGGGEPTQEIRLQGGRLYVNGELVHKGFSITQDHFNYLYFYVPERGLFTVSNREFDGATQAGTFEDETLSFNVGGFDVSLKSSTPILKEESSPAWVKFDPDFKLDVKSVMFGYGDKEKAPYEWPDQLKKNRH
jgi:hypothetical protein